MLFVCLFFKQDTQHSVIFVWYQQTMKCKIKPTATTLAKPFIHWLYTVFFSNQDKKGCGLSEVKTTQSAQW